MNDLVDNPFSSRAAVQESAGTRQVQARENTEVMAMAMTAKRFPRDQIAACDRIRNAFTRVSLAEKAQYQFSRGGSDIVGPSIRAAEAMSQQWGNMSNGWREISRTVGADGVGVSEVEAFSIDYETTSRESIQFVVRHWRDTKKGGYALKDERDIYELCANNAQRRKRACILAQIPGDVTEMAMDQASVTLKTSADTSPEGMKKMVDAFSAFGVTKEQIEKRIQRRLDSIQPAQVVALKRIYASLRDEMSTVSDWFDVEQAPGTATGMEAVKAAVKPKGGRAATVNQETGEITAPSSVGTFAQIIDKLKATSDLDVANVVIDEARGLPEDQYNDVAAFYRKKFIEGGKA